jgi:hypothetical protein
MIKIHFHSITDIITNSSTTLFTYSDASPQACEEMIDEIFKTFGIDKKCSDVFRLTVLAEDAYIYDEWKDRHEEDDDDDLDEDEDEDDEEFDDEIEEEEEEEEEEEGDVDKLMQDIIQGRSEKPSWMTEAEQEEDGDGYAPNTTLYIVAKSPEFEKLAELIVNFLYSTRHTATGAD